MKAGWVRIIGGQWRGRRLKVPDRAGLRPTPDRVRETLFNWLSPYLAGARCLDLFAGSGALGFEAASRGALMVTMVDESQEVMVALQETISLLEAKNITLCSMRVPSQWPACEVPYDVVFLDPPYQSGLLAGVTKHLEEQGYLAADAYIYLEASTPIVAEQLPSNWRLIKSKRAGQVFYHLAKRERQ